MICLLFYRAPLEEMLQRAGAGPGVNNHGPLVPEGPPINNVASNPGGKNFNFTPLQ